MEGRSKKEVIANKEERLRLLMLGTDIVDKEHQEMRLKLNSLKNSIFSTKIFLWGIALGISGGLFSNMVYGLILDLYSLKNSIILISVIFSLSLVFIIHKLNKIIKSELNKIEKGQDSILKKAESLKKETQILEDDINSLTNTS